MLATSTVEFLLLLMILASAIAVVALRAGSVRVRDGWTCQGCFYRPSQQDRDFMLSITGCPVFRAPS